MSDESVIETWKSVVGWEGFYEVSSIGAVRSLDRVVKYRDGRTFTHIGRRLRQHACGNLRKYLFVALWRGNSHRAYYVHRLVIEAFIGPIPPGHEGNHMDGQTQNNCLWNLEPVTRRDNMLHAMMTGLCTRGEGRASAKLTDDIVRQIRRESFDYRGAITHAEKKYGVSRALIRGIRSGARWKHVV